MGKGGYFQSRQGFMEFVGQCGQLCFLPVAVGNMGDLLCLAAFLQETVGRVCDGVSCGHDTVIGKCYWDTQVPDRLFCTSAGFY